MKAIRGGADKSLARPTSQCRRTESMCRIASLFLLQKLKESMSGRLTWVGWVHHSWRFGLAEALREVGPEMPECGSKTSTVPVLWANFGIFSAWSKWFPVASGDHGRNLVISLWPGDKATVNRVAAQRLTPPQKIPSAKIRWKSSRLDFLAIKTASSSLIIFQRARLSTRSMTHLCWCNWRTFWRKHAAGKSPRLSCSCTTMPWLTWHLQPRRNCLPGLPVSWSPTLFSGSGPVGLPPVPWTEKKQLKLRHFSSDADVIAAAETWLDGQPSEFFLSGLQS